AGLIFDSTTHFLLLGNTTCIPRFRKCLVKSNLGAIISPRGEKCGLEGLGMLPPAAKKSW
ncbi:MAG: hypothetical protein ACR2RB_15400, partial [Gammaproteobacteria bacterium]